MIRHWLQVACLTWTTFMALSWSPVSATERYKVTHIRSSPGIFFEKIGSLHYYEREYKLLSFISFENLQKEFSLILNITAKTEKLCTRTKMGYSNYYFNFVNVSLCHVNLHKLITNLEFAEGKKAHLFGLTAYRQQRGPFNSHDSGFKIITGHVDAYEGKQYNSKISNLIGEKDGIFDLVNDQTSVAIESISTFNMTVLNLNQNEEILNRNLEKLTKVLEIDMESEELRLLKLNRILDDHFSSLMSLLNKLQINIANIQAAVDFAYAGIMHPAVLNPSRLIDSLRHAEREIPSGFRFPVPLEAESALIYQRMATYCAYFYQDKLIFLVSFPLSSGSEFEYFFIHPLPFKLQDSIYGVIKPKEDYLAYSPTGLSFQLSQSDIDHCHKLPERGLLCRMYALFSHYAEICEKKLFLSLPPDPSCDVRLANFVESVWTPLRRPNKWMFTIDQVEAVDLRCRNESVTSMTLSGTGIFEMSENCLLYTSKTVLYPLQQFSGKLIIKVPSVNISISNFITAMDFTELEIPNNTELSSVRAAELNGASFKLASIINKEEDEKKRERNMHIATINQMFHFLLPPFALLIIVLIVYQVFIRRTKSKALRRKLYYKNELNKLDEKLKNSPKKNSPSKKSPFNSPSKKSPFNSPSKKSPFNSPSKKSPFNSPSKKSPKKCDRVLKKKLMDKISKRVKRTEDEYRRKGNLKRAAALRKARENPEFKEMDNKRRKEAHIAEREDDLVRKSENLKRAADQRLARENPEFKEMDHKRRKEAHIAEREDDLVRKSENLKRAADQRLARENPEFKEMDHKRRKEAHIAEREDDLVRKSENLKRAADLRLARENPEFKEMDKVRRKEAHIAEREDDLVRKSENIKRAADQRLARENPEFKEMDNKRRKEAHIAEREDDLVRKSENLKRAADLRLARENPEFQEMDNLRRKEKHQDERKSVEIRTAEKKKRKGRHELDKVDTKKMNTKRHNKRTSMRLLRDDEKYRRLEKLKDNASKRVLRLHTEYTYRKKYESELYAKKENGDKYAKAQLKFLDTIQEGPNRICTCCEGLWFSRSVVKFDQSVIESSLEGCFEKKDLQDFMDKIMNYPSDDVCKTCMNAIKKKTIPKMATSWGMKFPVVPDCVANLSKLEERMVTPFINFMQIRPLKRFALNPQLQMKGSVVNIMVEMGDMLQVLPRQFNEMATIQVKLKRHIEHKSDYKFETIRPALICKALNYLVNTPLYEKYKIRVNEEYFQRFREEEDDFCLAFIVDAQDQVDDVDEKVDINEQVATTETESQDGEKKVDNEELDSDSDFFNDDDEVLLTDANQDVVEGICSTKIIAPGQDKSPIAWHKFTHLDELCFPRKFAGQPILTHEKLSYSDRAKSEARRKDRRCCSPERILYMAKLKQEKAVSSSLNVCMRKSKISSTAITAKDALNKEFLNDAVINDAGFRVLTNIRSAPSYWEKRKGELLSMVRQMGHPTFFFTVSVTESSWTELLRSLYFAKHDQLLTDTQLLEMDTFCKTKLVRDDPVTCARYFDFKVSSLMKLLKSPDGPFGDNYVHDSYQKVEFQQRGSPHEHMFLWCRNAPVYNKNSNEECIAFIDKHITCQYDEAFPLLSMQRHVHTHTCFKGSKSKKVCRFHYPIPVMPRTLILEPLEEGQRSDEIKKNSIAIKKKMYGFYMKSTDVSFETILKDLNISEEEYILAIRSQIDKPRVFLKRDSLSVAINSHNKTLLTLFNSNIDIQYVLDPYSCASYMVNYITKIEAGLSKLLKTAAMDANIKGLGIRDKLRKIANVFLNANLMSAQEAAYHVMGLQLSKCSRSCIFVNSCPRQERSRMLKAPKDLAVLPEDCDDVFLPSITERYAERERSREQECLADFATAYRQKKSKVVSLNSESESNDDELVEADQERETYQRRKILRYRHYKISQDQYNFYREQILLFLPWRDEESDVENKNCEILYKENIETIRRNCSKYNVITEEQMDKALEFAQANVAELDEAEYEDVIADKIPSGMEVDIDEQSGKPKGGTTSNKKTVTVRIVTPTKNDWEHTLKTLRMLNDGQREIVMHVYSEIKKERKPLRLFISGAAGVGKSVVISVLYQLLTYYYEKRPGVKTDTPKVLLTAPSGKAAHLIGGVTLHTAFSLPVTKFGGTMPALSEDVANSLRCKLIDLKLLIIDEISMVGSRALGRVDTRLRQIMGKNDTFGGVSVIVVGDLHQLPPVMDKPVFEPPYVNELSIFQAVNPLWEEFSLYELNEIMRQKGEKEFILVLNQIARNIELNHEELAVLRSRKVSPTSVPESAIRLYSKNILVDRYNDKRIRSHPGVPYESVAEDVIIGKNLSAKQETDIRRSIKNRQLSDLLGLPNNVVFKIGIKYMITYNIEVDQGLVNGACGTLRHVTVVDGTVQAVWIEFPEARIGMKRKIKYADFMRENNIPDNLVRMDRLNSPLSTSPNQVFQIFRKQFPLVPAEALTVHKSQGQSYDEICLDFNSIGRANRQLLYVALSRVKSLKGLYILGDINNKLFRSGRSKDIEEIERLRSNKIVKLCYDNLKQKHGLTIIYHNVNSLRKSIDDLKRDCWYSRGDVLVFAETLHKKAPALITIGDVDFKCFHSSERVEKKHKRGLLVLVNSNVEKEIKMIKTISNCEKNKRNGVELILFSVGKYFVITGYKNPSCTNSLFFSSLKELLKKFDSRSNLVMLGDFNFDLMKKNPLEVELEKYKMKSILCEEISTTDFNTQIDVIFSNLHSSECSASAYESYFSDHKPVSVKIASDLIHHFEVTNEDENSNSIVLETDEDKDEVPLNVPSKNTYATFQDISDNGSASPDDTQGLARKVNEMNAKIDEFELSANTSLFSFSGGRYKINKHDLVSLKTRVSPEEVKEIKSRGLSSFHPLWLTDNIIDCYLYLLSHKCPHFTFVDTTLCQILAAPDSNTGLIHEYMSTNLSMMGKTHIALPFNSGGNHWVVTLIRLDENTYTTLDPMSATASSTEVKQGLSRFFDFISSTGEQGEFRQIQTTKKSSQTDTENCGVFVCWYAMRFAHYMDMFEPNFNANYFRVAIFNELIQKINH